MTHRASPLPPTLALALLGALGCGAGCNDSVASYDGPSGPRDGGAPDLPVAGDGGGPLGAAFTIIGCEALEVSGDQLTCRGRAPLELTFVPLAAGISTYLWTFQGASLSLSRLVTPTVRFEVPGSFEVQLAGGGAGGTVTAAGTVVVSGGGSGAPCARTADCAAGLACLCAGGSCPGVVVGFCARTCGAGATCTPGEVCVDLRRQAAAGVALPDGGVVEDGGADGGGPQDGGSDGALDLGAPADPSDGGAPEAWRGPLCAPGCASDADCRVGLRCREVRSFDPITGVWRRACFPSVGFDVGEACVGPEGPEPARCLGGACAPYGARGLCTASCGTCPTGTTCADFTGPPPPGAPPGPLCLRRCDAAHPCDDPLLACEAADPAGALGFSVPPGEPAQVTYCAPRRCQEDGDCPGGRCVARGAASFCAR